MAKLTKTVIDALEVTGERYEVADDDLKGFYIRVNRSGSKTAIVRYFKDGRLRAYTLGKLGEHFPLAKARKRARTVLGRVADGHDPAQERKRKLDAPLFSSLAERFMEEHARPYLKPRTVAGYETILRVHVLPALGNMRVEEIERCDVERLHQRVGKTAPGAANRMVAFLSCVMNKAETWGYRRLQSNPCYRMRRFKERKIERYLTGEERARLAEVLAAAERAPRGAPDYVCPGSIKVIRLLELTGARCGEILGLQWSMVQLERGCLALPESKTGAKEVPLSPQAVAYLAELARVRVEGVPWVCPGERGGPVHNLERAWRAIRKRAGIEDVRLHDLRHSAASDGADAGLSLPQIGKVLGHKSPQTTARYAHLTDRAQRDAARTMGEQIERSAKEGAERLEEERRKRERARLAVVAEGEASEGAKLAAGAEHSEGEAGEGPAVRPTGATVIRFPGRGRR